MAMILRAEVAKDWTYKGDGAANIVLSYLGSSRILEKCWLLSDSSGLIRITEF